MRKVLIGLGVAVSVVITTVMVTASIWPTINRVETGATLEYPELMPKTYQLGYDRVFDEAVAATKDVEGWTFVSDARDTGLIRADAEMPVTGWRHQITVRVERRTEFVSRVHAVSEGSDAAGDLGQNARNIRSVFAALDKRLGAAEVK
jgi:hypothetical protein